MTQPTSEEANRLVSEMWERVDGGCCDSCTGQAMEALAVVWPAIDWLKRFDDLPDRDV